LKNIYKELQQEYPEFKAPKHGYLIEWAKQGVFLVNSVMTVRSGQTLAHKSSGWTKFTDAAIKYINDKCDHVVFIMWGEVAQKQAPSINLAKHYVLKTAHPSPKSAHLGFFGCNHFRKANKWLESQQLSPINWHLSEQMPASAPSPETSQQRRNF